MNWLITVAILAIIAGVVYYTYTRRKKGKKHKR